MRISFCSFKPYGMSSVFYILQCYVCFSLSLSLSLSYNEMLPRKWLKVIQIFAVLYFHVFDKMTKKRIKKKQRWPCSCREKKEEWIFKNTIMLVNFIHKWVCFIGFIVAMMIVKQNLGNDKSPNSSPISSNEKNERKTNI